MKKVKGSIDILYHNGVVEIKISDREARVCIAKVEMLSDDFCKAAMGRLSEKECEVETGRLENVGKKYVTGSFSFKCGSLSYPKNEKMLYELAKLNCPEGWVPSSYFGSSTSFSGFGEEKIANCTMFKWEEIE